ncbi:Hypothetical predicted protein [Cloeon dipterum]|uniref:Uncharacterized protein n=1 Tax=Cloeon dipterum TaxID=197152 RepID=A0A8S1DJA1_9INSE|nr:Hypothetical predicted protein [Cloeon dipterum]
MGKALFYHGLRFLTGTFLVSLASTLDTDQIQSDAEQEIWDGSLKILFGMTGAFFFTVCVALVIARLRSTNNQANEINPQPELIIRYDVNEETNNNGKYHVYSP